MKNILLPTDFSDNSGKAITYAYELFKNSKVNVKFHLVHAYEYPQPNGMFIRIDDLIEREVLQSLAEEEKNLLSKISSEEKILVSSAAIKGDLPDVLENYSKNHAISLIIMGTKGASGVKELLIGSNASEVVRKAICPTILVPETATSFTPKNVVFACDYKSISNENVLLPLTELCRVFQSEVKVINITNGTPVEDLNIDDVGRKIDKVLLDIPHETIFISDEDAEEGIEKYCNKHHVDLLVMIPKRNNFFDRIFHKSVTNKVAMHTHVPLLAVHDLG